VFPEGFDTEKTSAKDYFDLMFAPEIIGDFVQHTNNYAKWKIEQKGSEDPVWYDVTENELRAYFGIHIFMGINELLRYKDYWSKDRFIGNEGIKSVHCLFVLFSIWRNYWCAGQSRRLFPEQTLSQNNP
jgi:hypothetical protein